MDDVYIYHAHTIFPLSLFCVGTHVHSSTSQSQELTKRALESIDDLGSRELPFPPLSSCNDYALLASCSFYRVHFACYACFYAFAVQLWPLLASTHDSPLCYSYVYLHAWWRSLLLLPCLSCASCYWCYFSHILLSCLCYVMWIIHAHYLHPWHACHDSF